MTAPVFAKLTSRISSDVSVNVQPMVDSISASSLGLKDARALGTSAYDGLTPQAMVAAISASSNLYTRWAKAYDAGSSDSDTTILVGSVISGIVIQGAILRASAATVRGRVWRRPLTSANLNLKPGQVDDVLITDTGAITPPADWPSMAASSGSARAILPTGDFEILPNYTYFADIEWRDSGGVLLATPLSFKTVGSAVPQRNSGFYYASSAASDWTALSTTRLWGLGFAAKKLKSINTIDSIAKAGGSVPAQAAVTKLTDMERLLISEQGSWNRIKRPGVDTTGNGLALLFGDSSWTGGVGKGVNGVDFGPLTALGSMTDGTTLPTWTAGTKRLLPQGNTLSDTVGGLIYEKVKLTDGYLDVNAGFNQNMIVRDFNFQGLPASQLAAGVVQNNGHNARVILENGYIANYTSRAIGMFNGDIRRVYVDLIGTDSIIVTGSTNGADVWSVNIEQCLVRRVANTSIAANTAAGDLVQTSGADNFTCYASTLYIPGTGTAFDESSYGSNNCVRIQSGNGGGTGNITKRGYVMGNLLAGGQYAVGIIVNGNNNSVQNHFFLGNRYAPLGSYGLVGHFVFYGVGSYTGCSFKNIGVFDERMTTGQPISLSFAVTGPAVAAYAARTESSWKAIAGNTSPYRPGEEKWGIFNFDRTLLSERDIELLHRYGHATGREILMWNNQINPAYDLGSLL